ncbi:hypothetical protein MWU38_02370 [Qipengyuania sp. S6317L1]|uniref:hypothetical protein n=1 Tax=Qipengyuania sp. S6317L1 TaxID=2926410 RepID=UPI001FF4E94D|nr:hypothetical protein [Qipengyuania sp. S6317L1]MCK0098217.1 hypothetical protein [Qipengyuania sp. S6317L1]
MHEPAPRSFAKQREDTVVSVCFATPRPNSTTFETIRKVVQTLDTTFRFREIILVVETHEREAFLPLVEEVSDVRLFLVRKGTEYYERRVIAAEEAIGDLVLIAQEDEVAAIDVLAFLERAESANAIAIASQDKRRPIKTFLSWPFVALGRLAGFAVYPSDWQSIAMPRTLLNHILAHDEPRLALRYPPRDPRLPLAGFTAETNVTSRGAFKDIGRRMQLLQTLLVFLTPIILSVVAISSTILTLVGIAYAAWIIGAVIMVDALAPGWLTTNTMLAVSAVFMGVSTLGLSLGLQHVLRQNVRDRGERVSEEVNRIDLFGKVSADLNVELESEAWAQNTTKPHGE